MTVSEEKLDAIQARNVWRWRTLTQTFSVCWKANGHWLVIFFFSAALRHLLLLPQHAQMLVSLRLFLSLLFWSWHKMVEYCESWKWWNIPSLVKNHVKWSGFCYRDFLTLLTYYWMLTNKSCNICCPSSWFVRYWVVHKKACVIAGLGNVRKRQYWRLCWETGKCELASSLVLPRKVSVLIGWVAGQSYATSIISHIGRFLWR